MYNYNHKIYKSLYDIMDIKDNDIVSVVGGGGKTSSIMQLSAYLTTNKRSHIIMTTTNMMAPINDIFNDIEQIRRELKKNSAIWVGEKLEKDNHKKIRQPKEEVKKFIFEKLKIPILIEADGAKRMPIKINREYEPVIPKETTKVLAVVGIDCIKNTINKSVFRPQAVADFLGKSIDDYLDEKDVAQIITSKIGLSKSILSHMKHFVFINKCDKKIDEERAIKIKNLINIHTIYGKLI